MTNKNRPDWMACIKDYNAEHIDRAYCGRIVRTEFYFHNIDHALQAQEDESRIVSCPDCLGIIIPRLLKGYLAISKGAIYDKQQPIIK